MSPIEQLGLLLKRLEERDSEITLEIQLITAWIKEHRESRPPRAEAPSLSSSERNEYQSWRKVSCRLHQRRSELKAKQEKIQMQILTVAQRIEEAENSFFHFPVFSDMDIESELASAGA